MKRRKPFTRIMCIYCGKKIRDVPQTGTVQSWVSVDYHPECWRKWIRQVGMPPAKEKKK